MTEDYLAIERRLERLAEEVKFLREQRPKIKSSQDLAKRDPGYLVERSLEVALEAVLDIGRTLIALERLPKPSTNEAVFEILVEAGIISEGLGERMRGMAGFRNILVHEYLIIDPDKVFENLKRVSDFEDFGKEIGRYLEAKR